ncbi:amidohydrolase/deacetylase family metallohydrolase [soil metagenome]
MSYDLVIHGGRVIDPAGGLDDRRDLGIRDGRIAAVEPHIPLVEAADVLDATDRLIVPGLVDLHVHVYWGVTDLSIRPGPSDLARGATTVVDAGSAGANTFPGFREYVIEPAEGRILAFLNISAMGQVDTSLGENHDLRYVLADRAAECARANTDLVVGVKVRLTEWLTGPNAIQALERAVEAGEAAGVPVMAHIGDSTATIEQVLTRLRPGDMVTHAFTDRANGIFDDRGRVHAATVEARVRGVLFDIGHGAGSFSFARAEAALADGFRPDTISSDLHRYNVDGPVHDLVTTLSKFLHLGLPLPEVIAMATTAPAQALGRSGAFGTLAIGAEADIAVLALEEGRFSLTDSFGASVESRQRLVPVATLRGGRRVAPTSRIV